MAARNSTVATPTAKPEKKRRATKRRGNGEGSIYLRKDGRWCSSITIGYNAVGKRIRRDVYGKTKGAVQDELTRLQASKLDGSLGEPSKLTLAAYLAHWLQAAVKPGVRSTTYVNFEGAIRNHVNPRLGGVPLRKLTPLHVQGLYGAMQEAGDSAHVRRLTHAVLRLALKQAVDWRMVPTNVCQSVKQPKAAKREIRFLSTEEVQTLLRVASGAGTTPEGKPIPADRLQALYVLAVTTGLRMGELFGLQWGDIDLQAGLLSVRRSLVELSGKLSLAEPKTETSRRNVALPAMAVIALAEHRKRMIVEGFASAEQVFVNQHGGFMRRSHFHEQQYKPLLKRAGLPPIRFHDLRHTAATLLLSEGVHPKVVQERLGHSQISVTMNIYSHVQPTMQREAAGKLDSVLGPAPTSTLRKAK